MAIDHAAAITTDHASDDKDRDQRILSAKKKLKSYRAKQALMANKRTSGSRQLTPAQLKRISNEASNTVADAVQATILDATEQAQQALHTTSYDTTLDGPAKRHSRSYSRAGHGRGHSRTGSISVTADRMASAANNALLHSFVPEQPANAHSSSSSPSANHVVHTRQHSRSASKRFSHLPSGGLTPSSSHSTLLAVEHGPEGFGPSGKPSDWKDMTTSSPGPGQSTRSPLSSPHATPRASMRNLGVDTPSNDAASTNTSVESTNSASSTATRRLSRHSRKTSLATKRESMELMGGLGFPTVSTGDSSSQSAAAARRASRSNRVSGNLFGGPDRRSALNQDFDWRGSLGLLQQQAQRDESCDDTGDRRTALEKLEGRGATSLAAPGPSSPSRNTRPLSSSSHRNSRSHSRQSSVQLPTFDDIHGQNGMDKRNSLNLIERNERNTSDDSSGPTTPASPWLGIPSSSSLGNISPSLANSSKGLSQSQSSPELLAGTRSPKGRPASLFGAPEAPEGLGTLMEEEEEEDITSPVKERNAPNFASADSTEDEAALKLRREEEKETIKRTRRSSLQPKPMKLKSRPASLFVSPAMQMKANLLLQSPSLASSKIHEHAEEGTAASSSDDTNMSSSDDLRQPSTDSMSSHGPSQGSDRGDFSRGWSMSTAQANVKRRAGKSDANNHESSTSVRTQSRRQSIPLSLSTRLNDLSDSSRDSAIGETATPSPDSAGRPGIRALRLGSMSGSQSSTGESGRATPTSLAQKRVSYISTSQSGDSISERGDVLPSPASKKSLRRSSLIYKAPNDKAENTTSSASAASLPSGPSVTSTIMTAFEELKAKTLRDAGTMEEQRKQIEKLAIDLSAESQRASREYAQLEQWSAEERRQLVARLEESQKEIEQIQVLLSAKESALQEASDKLNSQQADNEEKLEDLQAERDMLHDDVEGWRTRCGDLEKSARADKTLLEEERQRSYSLALRVQMLTQKLKEEDVDVPSSPTADDVAARHLALPNDLVSVLRSPAVNPYAPSVSTPSGYFSPRASPADAVPPPQAVKLLKDMRQQIFNLAGSLEHQRKEQLKSQEEADTLRKQNEELKAALELASSGHKAEQGSGEDAFQFDSPSADIPVSSSYERRNGGKQRHVFAYDSSMGSADQSSASMCSTSHTNLTSLSDHSSSATHDDKVDADGAEGVLPVPVLQPLVEEEDEYRSTIEEPAGDDLEEQAYAASHERNVSLFDLEAGGDAEEEDDEIFDDALGRIEDNRTPLASQVSLAASLQKTPVVSLEGQVLSLSSQSEGSGSMSARSSNTTCSLDTPGSTSLGDDGEEATYRYGAEVGLAHVGDEDLEGLASDDLEQPSAHYYDGDDDEDDDDDYVGPYSRDRKDRPEFIREWSFQEALQSVRKHNLPLGGQGKTTQRRRKAPRPPSVDDFFGLMLCEQLEPLPCLPTTHSSLEMPPVYVEALLEGEQAPTYGEATADRDAYHPSRHSIASARVAPVVKGRPPVARSAYVRESLSSNVDTGALRSGRSPSMPQQGAHELQQSRNGSFGMAAAAASTMVGGGSRALSRVSLQGLTSAFSGLGGYLAGSSGAAVHAAAAAGTMCSRDVDDIESRNPSVSWPRPATANGVIEQEQKQVGFVPQQRIQSMAGISGVKRFSSSSTGPNNDALQRRVSSATAASNRSSKQPYVRRFISRDDVVPPSASPVWSLDFLPCTEVAGGRNAFSV